MGTNTALVLTILGLWLFVFRKASGRGTFDKNSGGIGGSFSPSSGGFGGKFDSSGNWVDTTGKVHKTVG